MNAFMWSGVQGTIIKYDKENYRWLVKVPGNDVLAFAEASEDDLLFGTTTWVVENDRACFPVLRQKVNRSLNSCSNNQFNCNDGACIELDRRCNGIDVCKDASDEFNCFTLIATQNYNSGIGPEKMDVNQRKYKTVLRKGVSISLSVSDVLDINEIKGFMGFKFIITLKWKDERLKYQNLDMLKTMNSLTEKEQKSIWLIYLNNTDLEADIKSYMDATVHVIPTKENSSEIADAPELYNAKIFKGQDSKLSMTKVMRYSNCLKIL